MENSENNNGFQFPVEEEQEQPQNGSKDSQSIFSQGANLQENRFDEAFSAISYLKNVNLRSRLDFVMKENTKLKEHNSNLLTKVRKLTKENEILRVKYEDEQELNQAFEKKFADCHRRIKNLSVHQNSIVDYCDIAEQRRVSMFNNISGVKELACKKNQESIENNSNLRFKMEMLATKLEETINDLDYYKNLNEKTNADWKNNVEMLENEYEQHIGDLTKTFEEIKESMLQERDEVQEQNATLNGNIEDLKRQIKELENNNCKSTVIIKEFENRTDAMITDALLASNSLKELREKNSSLSNDIGSTLNENKKLLIIIEDLKNDFRKQSELLDETSSKNKTELIELKNDNTKLQSKIKELINSLEKEKNMKIEQAANYEARINEYLNRQSSKNGKGSSETQLTRTSMQISDFSDSDESIPISIKMGSIYGINTANKYLKNPKELKRKSVPAEFKNGDENIKMKFKKKRQSYSDADADADANANMDFPVLKNISKGRRSLSNESKSQ